MIIQVRAVPPCRNKCKAQGLKSLFTQANWELVHGNQASGAQMLSSLLPWVLLHLKQFPTKASHGTWEIEKYWSTFVSLRPDSWTIVDVSETPLSPSLIKGQVLVSCPLPVLGPPWRVRRIGESISKKSRQERIPWKSYFENIGKQVFWRKELEGQI